MTQTIDLYDFARLIKLNVLGASVASAAQNVMDKISVSVYKEAHGTDHPNAHGISIYMPLTSVDLTSYKNTKFASDTHWDEFLTKHYGSAAG